MRLGIDSPAHGHEDRVRGDLYASQDLQGQRGTPLGCSLPGMFYDDFGRIFLKNVSLFEASVCGIFKNINDIKRINGFYQINDLSYYFQAG